MSQSVMMPQLGESVTEGTVTRWLKSVGDRVEMDEPLLEISTDKVDTEIPSPVAGFVLEIAAVEDDVVPVGGLLARIGEPGEEPAPAPPPAAPAPPPAAPAPPPAAPAPPPAAPAPAPAPAGPVQASPLVRKLARESGVDLASIAGSGPGGRVTREDMRGAPVRQGRDVPMPRLRRLIAERMVESLRVSAQLTTVMEIDLTVIAALRSRAQDAFTAREGTRLTFLPFFARAALEALKAHPSLNASISPDGQTVTYHDAQHLAVAVDTDRGLLVPVVRGAGDLTLAGLARAIADLAERTRSERVGPDDLSGGTFTITNTGSRGALIDTPIINQPQVAILGTGSVVKRPVVVASPSDGDAIAIRSMAYFSLTYDHRLVDGADAARFLAAVKARLEEGAFDAELGL